MTCENDPLAVYSRRSLPISFFSLFFRASKIDFDVIILSSSSGVISGTDSIYLIPQTPLRRVKKERRVYLSCTVRKRVCLDLFLPLFSQRTSKVNFSLGIAREVITLGQSNLKRSLYIQASR